MKIEKFVKQFKKKIMKAREGELLKKVIIQETKKSKELYEKKIRRISALAIKKV